MIPRHTLDVSGRDLAFALRCSLWPGDRRAAQSRVENLWSGSERALASLSVRSGLDALLAALALREGSEVLVSAVTIRDMVRVVEAHGLRPVPVDVDMQSLAVDLDSLKRAVTGKSKAILAAHLFGSRMDMTAIVAFAREHGLYVLEDCAQAYAADGYQGHPETDAAMFSFGPIKTATALGGAVLRFRDPALCASVRAVQERYPAQSRFAFFRRVVKYFALRALCCRPAYTLIVAGCRLLRRDHDRFVRETVRGFSGPDMLQRIRRQPSAGLLALIERRLCDSQRTRDRVARRIAMAEAAAQRIPAVRRPGQTAEHHSHWVFPIESAAPEALVAHLQRQGFDATQGASSLWIVPPPPGFQPAAEATQSLPRLVYLPLAAATPAEAAQLAESVAQFEAGHAQVCPARS